MSVLLDFIKAPVRVCEHFILKLILIAYSGRSITRGQSL